MNATIDNGQKGFVELTGTGAHTPTSGAAWGVLEMLEDTVFAELHGNGQISGRDASTGVVTSGRTYPTGHLIFGRFHKLQLTSGALRASYV